MVTVEDLIGWRPGTFSEDHLTNFVREFFKDQLLWHVSYHNPPSGSWKELTMVDNETEYLQEIHKRGVGKMKRPDLVAQYLDEDHDSVTLLLFESKQEQSSWDPELPEMMRYFFEGIDDYDESAGVRNVPFWHKRQRNKEVWETLEKDDPERSWLQQADVSYIYGFGYLLGVQSPDESSADVEWMRQQLASYEEVPPIVLMGVGWRPETYEPFVVTIFSESFPGDLEKHLQTILPTLEKVDQSSTLEDSRN